MLFRSEEDGEADWIEVNDNTEQRREQNTRMNQGQHAPYAQKNAAEESYKKSHKRQARKKQQPSQASPHPQEIKQQGPCDNLSGEQHTHYYGDTNVQIDLTQMSYSRLQEAVVMSEVLGKPVSYKRRHRGR